MPRPQDPISANPTSNASGGDEPTRIPDGSFGLIQANPIKWGSITTSILPIRVQWGMSSPVWLGISRACSSLSKSDPSGPSRDQGK